MTLTQTAILVKQIIAASVISIILFIAGLIGYNIWYAYYFSTLPPVEEMPDVRFGVLPAPDFPQADVSSSNFSYSLDTVTGGLPKVGTDPGFEKIAKVYFVTQTFATFLSPQRSETLAQKFGIDQTAETLSETKYRFSSENKTLTVDLNSGNFQYIKEATLSAKINPEDSQKVVSDFKKILEFLGSFKEELTSGPSKVIFLKSEGEFAQTEDETQAVQVSLWPSPIDKKMIFTNEFNKSYVNAVIFGSADNLDNYSLLEFTSYPVDTSTFATYPIKSVEEAFDDLKTGQGVVLISPDKPQVSITAVSLGYFLSKNYQPYLLPIFVFEGPGYVAYVSAIKDQYISGQESI